jgi:hypothetical protein
MKPNASYHSETQSKNLAWFLPRPKPDHYKGGMPLHCEAWLIQLAKDILNNQDAEVLSLFAGASCQGFTVDIKPDRNPNLVADIHKLSQFITKKFPIIIADPPYSTEEAKEIYGTPPLKYKTWAKEAEKVLCPEGLLIVYHKYVMPNPDPDKFFVVKRVFIGNRPYHLPRVAIFFKRKSND